MPPNKIHYRFCPECGAFAPADSYKCKKCGHIYNKTHTKAKEKCPFLRNNRCIHKKEEISPTWQKLHCQGPWTKYDTCETYRTAYTVLRALGSLRKQINYLKGQGFTITDANNILESLNK